MKHLKFLKVVCIITILCFSCKKNTDSPDNGNPAPPVTTVNWTEELKNTLWAGEYKYTTGVDQSLQPFSLLLKDDGTITWADVENERAAGTWKVNGSQINFSFINGGSFSASLARDSWSNLKSGAGAGLAIDNIASTVRPNTQALLNTTWLGNVNGLNFSLNFLKDDFVKSTVNGGESYYTSKYTISLAGIRFKKNTPGDPVVGSYYGIFQNGSPWMINIFRELYPDGTYHYKYWNAKK